MAYKTFVYDTAMDEVLREDDLSPGSPAYLRHQAAVDDAHVAFNQCNLRMAATIGKFSPGSQLKFHTTI